MVRIKCLLLCLIACQAVLADVTIDSDMALQMVKDLQTDTLPKAYRVYEVDSLETDPMYCSISNWPTETWAQNGVPKWLVFVDKEPWNNLWSHSCTYYYLPKTVATLSDTTFLSYEGLLMPPVISNGEPIYLSEAISPFNPDDALVDPAEDMLYAHSAEKDKIYVVIIAGGFNPMSNHMGFYNTSSYLYKTLVKNYNIPKERIFVHLGSGGYANDMMDDADVPVYKTMPMDLDGDGLSDVHGSSSYYDVWNTFRDLPNHGLDSNSQLLVIIATHGTIDVIRRPCVLMWNGRNPKGHSAYASDLNYWLSLAPCKVQSIIIASCKGGGLVSKLENPSRVVVSAVSEEENATSGFVDEKLGYDTSCNYFLHKWTNAIRGYNYFGEPVNADQNGDRQISMKEAFDYASEDNFELEHYYYDLPEHPIYSSPTSWLGQELTFNFIPGDEELYIKDNSADTGLHYNSTSTVVWNSPDIWIRNQSDGFSNLQSEQPKATTDGKIYIYTRIHNRGHKDYMGDGAKLHLYWSPTAMGLDNSALYGSTGIGGLIASPEISEDILQDSSIIVETEWQVPHHLIVRSQSNGGLLPIHILAGVSTQMPDLASPVINLQGIHQKPEWSNAVAVKRDIVVEADKGPLQSNNSDSQLSQIHRTKIPIYLQGRSDGTQPYSIALRNGTLSGGTSAFSRIDVSLNLSPTIYASWLQNGQSGQGIQADTDTPGEIHILSDESVINGLGLASSKVDSVELCVNMDLAISYIDSTRHQFDIVLLDSAGNICDGTQFRIIVPGKKQGGTGPAPDPVFLSISGSPKGGQLVVELTEEVGDGLAIVTSPVFNGSTTLTPMNRGDKTALINTSRLPSGPFILSLQKDGTTIDSVQMIK